jgi:hypothetical protein
MFGRSESSSKSLRTASATSSLRLRAAERNLELVFASGGCMMRRARWLLGIALLALDACRPLGTEGTLGHGDFGYVCAGAADIACTDTINVTVPESSAPDHTVPISDAIAVGVTFSLLYSPDPGVGVQSLESTTPSILQGGDGQGAQATSEGPNAKVGAHLTFVRAGQAGVLVTSSGVVVDFLELTGKDIATLIVGSGETFAGCAPSSLELDLDGGTAAGPGDGGTGLDGTFAQVTLGVGQGLELPVFPVSSIGTILAGPLEPTATSLDETIVSVAPASQPGSTLELCGMSPGTAIVTLVIQGKTFSLGVVVQ